MSDEERESRNVYEALFAARRNFKPVRRTAANTFHKTKYADLYAVQDAYEEALMAEGLLPYYTLNPVEGGGLALTFTVRLVGGHPATDMVSSTYIIAGGQKEQAVGSSITYGKRYLAVALLNLQIRGEDDDAERAMDRSAATKERRQLTAKVSSLQKQMGFEKKDTEQLCATWMEQQDIRGVKMKDLTNDQLRWFIEFMEAHKGGDPSSAEEAF